MVDPPTTPVQRGNDPRAAVGATVLGVDLGDLGCQPFVGGGSFRARGCGGQPLVEARTPDTQDPAQPCNAEDCRGVRR
ncbi:hypothetical protein [Saccharopolyspora pogona]|uniref:hypothetical protein n=1 Tax=Saccharopolyspora pogona TaxID=333966 RepID=UPI001CC22108|nr:hypothetical protein [Saccharopolyspora pogona]